MTGAGLRLLVFFLMFTSRSAAALQETPAFFARGLTEFSNGNYGVAAMLFAQAEEASPGTTDALLYEGKARVHLEQFSPAESALRRYLTLHPDSGDALYLLGYVLHRENKAGESLDVYSKAAQQRTPAGDDLKVVGLDYVLLNDYPDAIRWLERAVEAEPNNKEAWYFLGRAYYTRSRIAEARRAFLRVLEIDPQDAKAENNLGLVLESEGQPDAAIAAYHKAIAWQEGSARQNAQPYLNLGSLLIEEARVAEAIPVLQKAVGIAPNDALCHLRLGTAFLRSGKPDDARRSLEKAVILAPEDAAAHYQLGKLYKQLKLMDLAKVEFDRTAALQGQAAASGTPQ